ncbi:MAG TPA: glycosyltransferase family 4 protein [Rhodospirillales bacterium]|nr:glycosyltransferase family 4 protein [Rhodospirillales bacterium]
MRILLVHNEYVNKGGEDVVLANEAELLKSHGHEVTLATVSNKSIHGAAGQLRTALFTASSPFGARWMRERLAETRPDVVHVHNFFPLLSPSIYGVCNERGVPVVQTLHNYRTLCSNAMLLRDDHPCELCVTGSPYQGVRYGCYRNPVASLPLAHMIARHRSEGTWQRRVDRFIALTEFARSRFLAAGFPAEKVVAKPNFVADPGEPAAPAGEGESVLFVGRLAPEKGIATMMRAWEGLEVPLAVAGDGPLRPLVEASASHFVRALGWKSGPEVAAEMGRCRFMVMPSEWYEGFPMTLVEAFSMGRPVLVSRLGSMAEVIEDGVTGLHVNPADPADLAAKVRWACDHPDAIAEMGRNARAVYLERYTAERNYAMLIDVYEQASRERRTAGAAA